MNFLTKTLVDNFFLWYNKDAVKKIHITSKKFINKKIFCHNERGCKKYG